jgi:hypothetical protein
VIGSGGRPLIAIFSLLLDDQGTQVNWRNAGCAFAASRKMCRQSTCKAYSGNDVHDEYFRQRSTGRGHGPSIIHDGDRESIASDGSLVFSHPVKQPHASQLHDSSHHLEATNKR